MNCLVILPDELVSPENAVITGARAAAVRSEHELVVGLSIAAAVRNGKIGRASVEAMSDTEVRLALLLDRDPPTRMRAELIVAVPRPQTAKKIIHLATTLGIEQVHFIRALHTVKSYLQSSALTPEAIEEEVLKGLAQAVDSVAPVFEVHRSFERFAESVLPTITARRATCVIGDTDASQRISPSLLAPGNGCALAIGPEAGWSDGELAAFSSAGFRSVSFGPRMLRVDTAALMGLAELGVVARATI